MHVQIHVSLPFSKLSRITQHLNNLDNDECSQDSHACHANATFRQRECSIRRVERLSGYFILKISQLYHYTVFHARQSSDDWLLSIIRLFL